MNIYLIIMLFFPGFLKRWRRRKVIKVKAQEWPVRNVETVDSMPALMKAGYAQAVG